MPELVLFQSEKDSDGEVYFMSVSQSESAARFRTNRARDLVL